MQRERNNCYGLAKTGSSGLYRVYCMIYELTLLKFERSENLVKVNLMQRVAKDVLERPLFVRLFSNFIPLTDICEKRTIKVMMMLLR